MNPYLIGGTAILVIILSVLLKNSYERTGELEALLKTQAAETIECADANDSSLTTIAQLESTINRMVEDRRVDAERREQILVERERELAAAIQRADLLEEERNDEINQNPDCADLASLSVDFFCPTTGSILRERSRSQGGHRDTND